RARPSKLPAASWPDLFRPSTRTRVAPDEAVPVQPLPARTSGPRAEPCSVPAVFAWMPGTSPGMTLEGMRSFCDAPARPVTSVGDLRAGGLAPEQDRQALASQYLSSLPAIGRRMIDRSK